LREGEPAPLPSDTHGANRYIFLAQAAGTERFAATVAHTHELSRNIWVALVIVLIVWFELKWPGGS
jgi:hypothetical protein